MFDVLMGVFNNPLFWTMVVAVVIGYIIGKSLPFILVGAMYVIAFLAWVMGLLIAVVIGSILYITAVVTGIIMYLWANAKAFLKSLQGDAVKKDKA